MTRDEAVGLARYYVAGPDERDTHRGDCVRLARALLALAEENGRLSTALRPACTLLATISLMDDDETTGRVKVSRSCMPSIACLFTEQDGDALYLNEAIRRYVNRRAGEGG